MRSQISRWPQWCGWSVSSGGSSSHDTGDNVPSETAWEDLAQVARGRLGMVAGQKNVLLRIVLRDLERTLTDVEGNQMRDHIYAALHQGTVHQWAR